MLIIKTTVLLMQLLVKEVRYKILPEFKNKSDFICFVNKGNESFQLGPAAFFGSEFNLE